MNAQIIERLGAVIGGIAVGAVAFYALYIDWKTPGLENNVFKIMLFLLGLGAVLALLAGLNVIGFQPKGA
jgi:F0F1-type ATP synthase membrane subunit c/vacuolar-type H+-ATPase subunit K